jgi:hypothetical protein
MNDLGALRYGLIMITETPAITTLLGFAKDNVPESNPSAPLNRKAELEVAAPLEQETLE